MDEGGTYTFIRGNNFLPPTVQTGMGSTYSTTNEVHTLPYLVIQEIIPMDFFFKKMGKKCYTFHEMNDRDIS